MVAVAGIGKFLHRLGHCGEPGDPVLQFRHMGQRDLLHLPAWPPALP